MADIDESIKIIGNPAPLGLFGFSFTTGFLMWVVMGWVPATFSAVIVSYAMFYGGFLQFLAGVFELVRGNTFGAAAFCSYGIFWMAYFLTSYLEVIFMWHDATTFKTAQTLMFVMWGILTTGFVVPALRKCVGLVIVFSTLAATFFFLAGGVWNTGVNKTAGYIGWICSLSALYTGFGELYREDMGVVLPGLAKIKYV